MGSALVPAASLGEASIDGFFLSTAADSSEQLASSGENWRGEMGRGDRGEGGEQVWCGDEGAGMALFIMARGDRGSAARSTRSRRFWRAIGVGEGRAR